MKNSLLLLNVGLMVLGFSGCGVAKPVAATIEPVKGSVLGGDTVIVMGTGFSNDTTLSFGGVAATHVSVSADGRTLTAITPLVSSIGARDLVLDNRGELDTLAAAFTFVDSGSVCVPCTCSDGFQPQGMCSNEECSTVCTHSYDSTPRVPNPAPLATGP